MSVAPAAAAAGAAGGAGALGALGPWMFAAQGLNFLGDAIGGNQQSQALAAQTQLQGLYTKLAPVNTRIAFAGQELMANIAPYLGAESAQTNLIGQSIYDMFTGARSKESQQAGLQTGLASMFVQAAGDVQKTAAMGRVATGLKGMETQAKLAEKGADVLGLQYTNLAKGITDVGTSAANMRNKLLENQQIANLETAKGLALERGRGEREEMHRRSARSAALNAGGFA
jgi:hypothetical protein